MSDIALSIRGLGKAYTISHNKREVHSTLAETVLQLVRNPRSARQSTKETFWALKDLSFDIQKGDVVGIIGRNGAGKSTMLKILSRITEPTTGTIDLYGRVGSLLEVGTGFHPELTGRENIFLNGAILGMRKPEIRRQFDGIVDFAGVEKFLDTPVKRYSSGMYVRLAFAVAAHLDSEILIVDEVLAVGDAEFQRKCMGKMQHVAHSGRTVLFVSHQMQAVSTLCNKAVYLDGGRLQYIGEVGEAVRRYSSRPKTASKETPAMRRPGSGELRFGELTLDKPEYLCTEPIILDATVCQMVDHAPQYFVSMMVTNAHGLPVLHLDSRLMNVEFRPARERRIRLTIPESRLAQGEYHINAYICTAGGIVDVKERAVTFEITPILPYPATLNCASSAVYYPEFDVVETEQPTKESDRTVAEALSVA